MPEYILALQSGGRAKNTIVCKKTKTKKKLIYSCLKACSDFHLHFERLHVRLRPSYTCIVGV